MKRFLVEYGISCNLKHEMRIESKDDAIDYANKMVMDPRYGYSFANVYDTAAKGPWLVWSYRDGFNELYVG